MKRALFSTAVQRFSGVGLGILTTWLLTNVMTTSQFGYYSYVIGIVTLVFLVAQIGLPQLALRETIRAIEADNSVVLVSVVRWSYLAVTISAAIAMAALAIFAFSGLADDIATLILLALPLVVLTSWNAVRASILRAYGWVTRSQMPENIVKPGALLLLVLGMAWSVGEDGITARQAILANVYAVALAFVVGFFMFRLVHKQSGVIREYQHKTWMLATFGLGLTTSLRAVSQNISIVLLGTLSMVDEAGVFKVAFLIGAQIGVVLQIANIVLAKDVGAALERGDDRQVERLLRRSSLLTTLASAALLVFLLIFGRALLAFAFPPAFAEAYWPMIILAAAQVANCFTGSVGLLLNLARREWDITFALTVSTVVSVALNVALIPSFGMIGAALAALAGIMVWNLLLFRKVGRDFKLKIGVLAGLKDALRARSLW